jgi:hypothetical protein
MKRLAFAVIGLAASVLSTGCCCNGLGTPFGTAYQPAYQPANGAAYYGGAYTSQAAVVTPTSYAVSAPVTTTAMAPMESLPTY